ncbi:MAG: hypothetical protein QOG87_2631 [Actinomycetota bacterium]|jgi:DNA-binding NarL/FixJ family response regulator
MMYGEQFDVGLIRVMVADARGSDRLRCRLELGDGGCSVVAEAVEARQAAAVAAFECPDVVLVDPELPNPDGVDLLGELRVRVPRARVVVRSDSIDLLDAALRKGAHGIVHRDAAGEDLRASVRRAFVADHDLASIR